MNSLVRYVPYIFILFVITLLPFPQISVWILILLIVIWLYENNFQYKFNFIKNNKAIVLLPLLYIFYWGGLLHTSNFEYAFSKLETKLGLLVIPIILHTFLSLNYNQLQHAYLKTFLYTTLILSLVCFIRSLALFLFELYCRKNHILLEEYPYTNYFFSSYLSFFMHYGYFAMYVNAAIIVLYELYVSDIIKNKMFMFLMLLWLSVFVMMLYSKAGILTMYVVHIFYLLNIITRKFHLNYIFYFIAVIFISTLILLYFVPYTKERINTLKEVVIHRKIDTASVESTNLRAMAWDASYELIKKEPLWGYGTGDVNDHLIKKYRDKHYTYAFIKELNSHNQFLQTLLALGIIGTLPLILFFVIYTIISILQKNFALLVFTIITFIAFLFESYLETQAGVFYITIFSWLFYRSKIT